MLWREISSSRIGEPRSCCFSEKPQQQLEPYLPERTPADQSGLTPAGVPARTAAFQVPSNPIPEPQDEPAPGSRQGHFR